MTLIKRTVPALLADWPFRDIASWPAWPEGDELELWHERNGLKIEEFRQNGTLVIRAEMPGIDPDEDVEVTVADGVLHLSAERREEHESSEDEGYFRSEFRYGRFRRTLPLPAGVSRADISASYTDGILEIRVPLADADGDAVTKVPIERS